MRTCVCGVRVCVHAYVCVCMVCVCVNVHMYVCLCECLFCTILPVYWKMSLMSYCPGVFAKATGLVFSAVVLALISVMVGQTPYM